MGLAVNGNTEVAYIAEVTAGTTPATPAFKRFRATGESGKPERKYVYSSELNGKRGQKTFAVASAHGSGGLDFEFTDETLDDLLESALRNAWATDVLIDANTPKAFTVQTKFESGATDIFKRLTGAEVNTLSLNIRAAEKVEGSASFLALNGDFANTAIAGATYVDGNVEPILVGANVGNITLNALTFDTLTALTLNLNNSMRTRHTLNGQLSPHSLGAGTLEVTGSATLYLNEVVYNMLRAGADGTATGLTFEIGKTVGKKTRFEMPNVVLEAPDASSPNTEGDVMVTFNFRALQSTAISGGVIRVTRNL